MRISDWSSDVCSSDLDAVADARHSERYGDDAIEIAEHVRARLSKDKLIVMAHSWGTVVGMGAALERPDLFHADVGIGQVINVRDNERISFEYGLAQAREHGNAEAIAELESIAPYPGDQPITRERESEERRVGKECASTGKLRGCRNH